MGSSLTLPCCESKAFFAGEEMLDGSFAVEDLQYNTIDFDPSAMMMKQQIASAVGLSHTARMEAMTGSAGGQNFGTWTLSNGSQSFILKAVRCKRHHAAVPTETENFLKLAREYPSVVHDQDIAFPVKIFRCHGPAGNTHNLIAMRKAHGECFTNIINMKCYARQIPQLMDTLEAAGRFIANLHNKHGLKHGDCQPSNMFLDEASGKFTMIDVSDLSPAGAALGTMETDVDHFCGGVRILTSMHGEQISSQAIQRVKAGYMMCRPSPM
jgi:tRNA A-37 threonylcarbamoyl transferase component Bud32